MDSYISRLKFSLGFSHGYEVSRQGLGGDVALLWHDHIDVQLLSYSNGHIDVCVKCLCNFDKLFFTGFHGHWMASQRCHSWGLLRRIGENRVDP